MTVESGLYAWHNVSTTPIGLTPSDTGSLHKQLDHFVNVTHSERRGTRKSIIISLVIDGPGGECALDISGDLHVIHKCLAEC